MPVLIKCKRYGTGGSPVIFTQSPEISQTHAILGTLSDLSVIKIPFLKGLAENA